MANKKFKFNDVDSIITYDLEDNDISAQEIADSSDGMLYTYIKVGGIKYNLPNTTLTCSKDKESAKNIFINAFNNTQSDSEISRLFITEVDNKSAYIQDEN